MEKMEKFLKSKIKDLVKQKTFIPIVIIVAVVLVVVVALAVSIGGSKEKEPEIITTANLKRIIEISELSTYECVYNGIATVYNEKKEEKVDFYVAYDAKVKVGINLEAVEINVNDKDKIITIDMPEVEIQSVEVSYESMDFIFKSKKAETSSVTARAYKQCESDVKNETANNDAIYELAEKNAENIIKGLVSPFVSQFDSEYTIDIK